MADKAEKKQQSSTGMLILTALAIAFTGATGYIINKNHQQVLADKDAREQTGQGQEQSQPTIMTAGTAETECTASESGKFPSIYNTRTSPENQSINLGLRQFTL